MKTITLGYRGFRFPSEFISHAVWLCHRFYLSFHEVEKSWATRDISVTDKTIRQGCQKFGTDNAQTLKKRQGRLGEARPIDQVLFTIHGQRQDLWHAVDQDSDCLDILPPLRRNQPAAERFFRRLLTYQGNKPRWLVTDTLQNDGSAHRTIMCTVNHMNHIYANYRAEVLHMRRSLY